MSITKYNHIKDSRDRNKEKSHSLYIKNKELVESARLTQPEKRTVEEIDLIKKDDLRRLRAKAYNKQYKKNLGIYRKNPNTNKNKLNMAKIERINKKMELIKIKMEEVKIKQIERLKKKRDKIERLKKC